ncbi:MAG: glycoside hydrolase family 3 N-terminal domain-containing protein [Deltaproteobacteria bacterium]|nr:glycoside hydrolase family 3 N-terminal domain-containing protein [Deltaproteobacteria bacterium]
MSVPARLVVVVTLLSLTAAASPVLPAAAASDSPWAVGGVDVATLIDQMSLEQKVGQMLLLGFGGTQMDGTIAAFLDEMQPGGVALFTRNISGPEQTMKLVQGIRGHDVVVGGALERGHPVTRRLPPFIAVDQEGGNVVRLKSQAAVLPSAMALGAADDVELAREVGRTLGEDLVAWGFNMNLAPVLDVNSNPRNPVIGIRSFGGDAKRVAEIGVGYARGLGDAGVVAVAKHFPGHGDTDVDSHYGLPVLQHDRARLFDVELRPFARAFAEGLPAIMTAHIALPMIAEGGDVPATVSHKVLTGLLRDELSYDGLVITDGLEMQGMLERFGAGEAAIQAVVAGADMVMVLWSVEKKREVRQALLDAATSGRLPRDRLDQAVRRVLEAKARAGLFQRPVVDIKSAKRQLARHDRKAMRDVARRAVTVVKDRRHSLPLTRETVVAVAAAQPAFLQGIAAATRARTLTLSWTPNKERVRKDAARLVELAKDADVVVVGMQNGDHAALVRAVQTAFPDKPIVVVSFGSPYLIYSFPTVSAYVCAFGWRDDSARAAAKVLIGAFRAEGRMPVSLAAAFNGDTPSPDDADVVPVAITAASVPELGGGQ